MSENPATGAGLRVAIVVHGRFHAFDLAEALGREGVSVDLYTHYPRWAVRRFGVRHARIIGLSMLGLGFRLAERWRLAGGGEGAVQAMTERFGRRVRRDLRTRDYDLIYIWSTAALEVLECPQLRRMWRFVVRESSHIRAQSRVLEAEGQRTGIDLERPSAWSLDRESREYLAADRVVLTSGFARRSFIAEGVPAERLLLLRAAALLDRFRATPEVVAARAARIAAGSRLRVLFVGSISLRKGFHDFSTVVEALREAPIDFHVIGNGLAETQSYRQRLRDRVHFHERVAEPELRAHYAAADLFFMPTLEDGGPFTLLQAQANGLPVLATDQCIATDVIEDGRNGWMVRAGDAAAMIERLRHCLSQPEELAAMAARLGQVLPQQRDWRDVALELIAELRRLGRKPACA